MDSSDASLMWSNIVKKDPPSKPSPSDGAPEAIPGMVGNCKSKEGISTVVFDANAVIEGRESLTNLAGKLVTVGEVISEIRDADSLRRLEFVQYTIEEPSSEALSKVDKFAKDTGDFSSLSDVDRKLIALTYTLEALANGTTNLRDVPPRIQTVRVKRLPEKELPGWGSNVPNLDDWEAFEKETEEISNSNSKILPLKDLNMNIITPKKTEVKHEGKMVVEGVDASQGQCDDDGWTTVGRKTPKRRKAKRDQQADKAGDVIVDPTHPQKQSSVACMTGDYAMQNVILQMGLRLLAPGGMQIRQLKRWLWKGHCCGEVTPHFGTGFCGKCGNGGTLRKVALTIDEHGTTVVATKLCIPVRGTKFSIPMPRGGRDGVTKNMVLRADQLPQKLLHPKTKKKKASKPGDEHFPSEDVFLNQYSDKKTSFKTKKKAKAPVRNAMAIFNQRRNPNDNHYSRSTH